MLFYPHLLPVIAVLPIFMQTLMTHSIYMLDKKDEVSLNDINCYNLCNSSEATKWTFPGKKFLFAFQIGSYL